MVRVPGRRNAERVEGQRSRQDPAVMVASSLGEGWWVEAKGV